MGAAGIAASLHGSAAFSVVRSRVVQHCSGVITVLSVAVTLSGVVFANTSSVSNSAQSGDVSVTVRVTDEPATTRPSAGIPFDVTAIIGPFVTTMSRGAPAAPVCVATTASTAVPIASASGESSATRTNVRGIPTGSATVLCVSLLPAGVTKSPIDSMLNQSRSTRSSDRISRTPSMFESDVANPFHTSRPLNWSLHSDASGSRKKSFGTPAFM